MSRLTVSQRIRIVRAGFESECARLDKAHLHSLSRYAVLPARWHFLPDSPLACEDIGRQALREMLEGDHAQV